MTGHFDAAWAEAERDAARTEAQRLRRERDVAQMEVQQAKAVNLALRAERAGHHQLALDAALRLDRAMKVVEAAQHAAQFADGPLIDLIPAMDKLRTVLDTYRAGEGTEGE